MSRGNEGTKDKLRDGDSDGIQIGSTYEGYQPISASGLAEQTHRLRELRYDEKVAYLFQRKSFLSVAFCIVLIVAFLFIFVWQILIGNCQISVLCRFYDASSRFNAPYLFRTFDFKVPSFYVWLGLTSGTTALVLVSIQRILFYSEQKYSRKISFTVALIKRASSSIIVYHYLVLVIPAILFVVVLGVFINWRTAGSFSLGITVCTLGNQIITQLNIKDLNKLASASALGSKTLVQIITSATYGAILTCIVVFSLFSMGCSALYMMYVDIRAVSAFTGGCAIVVLSTCVSSTVLFDSLVTAFSFKPPFRAGLPPNVIAVVAANISATSGFLVDLFFSLAISAISTALAGTGMPYFFQNQFALCVFNHLYIDYTCGPFGYPQALSHASYICSSGNLYFEYPFLSESSSVSIFIAVPFVLVASTMLAYVLCWPFLYIRLGHNLERVNGDYSSMLNTIMYQFIQTVILTSCVLVAASAAVCFGFFGTSSSFQSSTGFGSDNKFPRIHLDGTSSQCLPNTTESSLAHLPRGAFFKKDMYDPLLVTGMSVGKATETASRMFACSCIGISLGTIVVLLYTWRHAHLSVDNRTGMMSWMLQNVVANFLTHCPVIGLTVIMLISSYRLYGPYGVGIASIGYVSSSAGNAILLLVGRALTNIQNVLISTQYSVDDTLSKVGTVLSAMSTTTANIISNCSAVVVSTSLIFSILHQAGLVISPRSLVGSPDFPPSRLISSLNEMGVTRVVVIGGALLGVAIPIFEWAILVLSTNRSATAAYVTKKSLVYQDLQVWPSIIGRLLRFVILENISVLLLGVSWSIIIGFGLGSRAMVTALVSATTTCFIISGIVNGFGVRTVSCVSDETGKMVQEVTFGTLPGLQASLKAWVSLGFIMSTTMRHDTSRGWIGLIILIVISLLVVLFSLGNHVRYGKVTELGGIQDEPEKWDDPGVKVSPFFDDGNTLDLEWLRVGSELRDKMKLFGMRHGRVERQTAIEHETIRPRPQTNK